VAIREFAPGRDALTNLDRSDRVLRPVYSILALHYHSAILITTSPLLMQEIEPVSLISPGKPASAQSPLIREPGDPSAPAPGSTASGRAIAGRPGSGPFPLWEELSADHAGHEMLVRARDSAVALIRSVCSPEIARTLH
jgi:hypothetical protein